MDAWGLRVGARADLTVVDASDPALAERDGDSLLDTMVFSSPTLPFARAMVGGRWVATAGPLASQLRAERRGE
jgi:cytosine/adenosine deaminase-related metal-dependent hydrolase